LGWWCFRGRELTTLRLEVDAPLVKNTMIEGFNVGNHAARKAGLGHGATKAIVERTIRGARPAGTVTQELGTGQFAGKCD